MPHSKVASKEAKETCCICCQPLSKDKDEVVFCVGDCQRWLHRFCASVTAMKYKEIIDNSTPFLCPCCKSERQQKHISHLSNALEALKLEISVLKEALSETKSTVSRTNKQSYAAATKTSTSSSTRRRQQPNQ